jgi:large subunit ribosomal protein L6
MFIKMAKKELALTIEIPSGVSVMKEGTYLVVKGPKGTLKRNFENPGILVETQGNEIKLSAPTSSKRFKSVVYSYQVHLKNAFAGVKEPFKYTLKVCSGHFPMNVSVANNVLSVKNFLGEKIPRLLALKPGVTVKVEGSIITVEGVDKELAGQVAADIEQATRRPGFDRRIFQDGIYIIEKAGKKI